MGRRMGGVGRGTDVSEREGGSGERCRTSSYMLSVLNQEVVARCRCLCTNRPGYRRPLQRVPAPCQRMPSHMYLPHPHFATLRSTLIDLRVERGASSDANLAYSVKRL